MHVAALTAYIDSALTDDKFAVELEGLVDQGVFVRFQVFVRCCCIPACDLIKGWFWLDTAADTGFEC